MTHCPDNRVAELMRPLHPCFARGEMSGAAWALATAIVWKLLVDLDRAVKERDELRARNGR